MNTMESTRHTAEILMEHSVAGVKDVHGVTFDGRDVWFAHGDGGEVVRIDPETGARRGALHVSGADAGVAFDGVHLWVIAGKQIHRVDRETGAIERSIPTPEGASVSGLAFHGDALWVGDFRGKKLHKLDAKTGAVLRTIESDRFVTGVSFSDDELWHGTYEGEGDDVRTELRRIDATSGEVQEVVTFPPGAVISGVEATTDRIFCGDHRAGKIRVVRRPRMTRAQRG
ncbi:MAG: glutamine cyclotransferase [Labilithrix sp.]|nr:glutamine cyclotransferase [Labilithrix sp.]MCW5810809.1 glutamine cyclotransferase [Labilithrix sp.]